MNLTNNNFSNLELNDLESINAGSTFGNFVSTTAAGGAGAVIGAKWGAGIGWLGGPAGSILGGVVGGGIGYLVYEAIM